jgi:hypothetical protein
MAGAPKVYLEQNRQRLEDEKKIFIEFLRFFVIKNRNFISEFFFSQKLFFRHFFMRDMRVV